MDNVSPLTKEQESTLSQLLNIPVTAKSNPEKQVDKPKDNYADYSRDILGSNIAGRFDGR